MAEDNRETLSNAYRDTKRSPSQGRREKVISWPSDHRLFNVQIAIEDQGYAEELRSLLEEDNKHRAHVGDRLNPTISGVVVLDETTLGYDKVPKGTDALRYVVLRTESADLDKLWEAGIRYVIPAKSPPNLVRLVIIGMELRLNIEQSPVGQRPQPSVGV